MRFSSRLLALLFTFVSLVVAIQAQTAAPLRIMPLGDSITDGTSAGTPGRGGYRGPLYDSLIAAGYGVDYVGTLNNNGALLADMNHEGHSGWRIDQLDSNIAAWFGTLSGPDLVLMHIGTNDFGQGVDTINAINRLDALILKIAALRPNAHIIVTNLMARGEPQNAAIQAEFNPFVADRVQAHINAGRKVSFLDMRSAVPLSDMPDNLHPSQPGYDKMAAAWMGAIEALPPRVISTRGGVDYASVSILFSKPVADTAGELSNYASDNGLAITSATLDASKRMVMLTTSAQALGATYTITVNNIVDRTPLSNPIAADTTTTFRPQIPRGFANNAAESSRYSLVYSLDLPSIANYQNLQPAYSVDNRKYIGQFNRVAYYVELQAPNGDLQYLWTSMDAFTTDVNKIAVPTAVTGAIFQQSVTNLNVISNVAGVSNVTGQTGNLEFWPTNYSAPNAVPVVGASGNIYDFGDTRTTTGTYGSMQVHNTTAGQTLFAFNNWGGSATGVNADFGIGNNPLASANTNGAQKDWTFANNAGGYSVKTIQVLVQTTGDVTAPTPVSATASFGRTQVKVNFSEPISAASVLPSNFTIDSGVSVLSATLSANQRDITLHTSAQPTGTPFTLTISGLRDTSANANRIVAGTSIAISEPALPAEIATNVGSAADGYHLVYSLDIPVTGNFNAAGASAYHHDERNATGTFDRVAYYVELQKPGAASQYVWTAMDAFTANRGKVGVPTVASGAVFQRNVTNLSVRSNVNGIVTGDGIATGNIEFWPNDYSQPNAATVPNASGTNYDFGDSRTTTGGFYGSMQVHNHGASQTLFAMNRFGTDGLALDLGIGNNTGTGVDWTFAANAGTYSRRILHVLVRPGQTTTPTIVQNVPEAAGYQLAATMYIPATGNFTSGTGFTNYALDQRADVGPFRRVAYYLELKKPAEATSSFVWTSMDAFTTDPLKIGIPNVASGAVFQRNVSNLNVRSNVAGIVTGDSIATGNIEFWPSNYTGANTAAVPNATTTFDFGDSPGTGAGYGSMQVHNYGASQTLFALNHWGAANWAGALCVGIGNNPAATTDGFDWTFTDNSGDYDVRALHVFVLPGNGDTIAPTITRSLGSAERNRVVISFSEPLADSAATVANFSIDNGLTVTGATLLANKTDLVLNTTAQAAGASYTITVAGVRDRAANLIIAGSTTTFTAPPTPAVLSNVAEAAGYKLIYQVAIPTAVPRWNVNAVPYSVNEATFGERSFDRVAYLMELDTNWVYASFNAHTNLLSKIGVPTLGVTGTAFQQNVASMNVESNVNGITTGTGITTGNIEFWGGNYTAANTTNVPGASGAIFDFGDQMTGGGHGSMQVHNYGAGQTLFGFNNWGSNATGSTELGIGSNPNASATDQGQQSDWTHAGNAAAYTTRNLCVLARLAPTGAAAQIFAHPTSRLGTVGGEASFSVGATGPSQLSYQWRRNGAPIDGATNPFLDIAPITAGSAGTYDVVVTTAGGVSTTSLGAALTLNTPPTFAGYRIVARRDTPSTITYAALLAKAADADGDSVSIIGTSATSAANGTITAGAGSLTYTPAAGFVGADSFSVMFSDGRGGTANAVVQVTVSSLIGNPTFDGKIIARADGKIEALFAGTPGAQYVIERATVLALPTVWQTLTTVTVGDDGLIPLVDPAPPVGKAFYRARPVNP